VILKLQKVLCNTGNISNKTILLSLFWAFEVGQQVCEKAHGGHFNHSNTH